MQNSIKQKILELRSKGYSYNQIKNEIGCSKGTISFHCGNGQKEKTKIRSRKRRNTNPLVKKIEKFCEINKKIIINEHMKTISIISDKKLSIKLNNKIMSFSRDLNNIDKKMKGKCYPMFTIKEFVEKIGDNPTCYLTGERIDLNNTRSYHLDHIVPRSKGGDNSLSNCQIACRTANLAKGDLLLEEFFELCEKVIKNKLSKIKNG